jgi:DNA replication protein DnaC
MKRSSSRSGIPGVMETVTDHLAQLHLPTMRQVFAQEAERARKESLAYEQYLETIVTAEVEARRVHRVARLLRDSRLPLVKTLQTLDTTRLPKRIGLQLPTMIDGSFLDRRENLLAFGNPGSGKTHLVCAIGHELVRRGRRVLFTSTSRMMEVLLQAKRDLRLDRALKRLRVYEAVILDDIGYVQHDRDEMEVLFALLADRYERGSIVLTSNLPFSKWETIFKDPMTTAAAIDRLVHHSIILELNVRSYRLEMAEQARAATEVE